MKLTLIADGRTASGGTPLLMHNERLADRLDPITRALAEVTSMTKKTDADLLEVSRREFFGGLYTDPWIDTIEDLNGQLPRIPAANMVACLADAARKFRLGRAVEGGVAPLAEFATFSYDGPTDIQERWQGQFLLRKGVVLGGKRVTRTRPLFTNWSAEVEVEYDPEVINKSDIDRAWNYAGRLKGLCDRRPQNGKFKGSVKGAK